MSKTRLNVSLDQDLAEFARDFAAQNRTSVANIVTLYLLALKQTTLLSQDGQRPSLNLL